MKPKARSAAQRIISRPATDEFDAYLIAQGMENAGASVFSISHNGTHHRDGALIPCSRFVVWAKHDKAIKPDDIDKAIEAEYDD